MDNPWKIKRAFIGGSKLNIRFIEASDLNVWFVKQKIMQKHGARIEFYYADRD